MRSKVRLRPKNFHRAKRSALPRINMATTMVPELCAQFAESVVTALEGQRAAENTEERWCLLWDTIHSTALSIFGKKERRNRDWYDESLPVMEPAMSAKRDALKNYKREPSNNNLAALRTARNEAQRTARYCANQYWHSIQEAADKGNTRGVYEGMKKALGPSARKTAPLKSSTGDASQIAASRWTEWTEHYQDLYLRESVVTEAALNSILSLPVMEELDTPPTEEELSKAIDSLARGKAPGGDGIPAEVLQCVKSTLLHHLYELLCQCWEEGYVPQDMRDANIVTLYKSNGDRSDCNNYSGISLLSVLGKVFARVALQRLQQFAAWLQSAEAYHRHDFHPETVAGEVPGTETAPVRRFRGPDKGV